MSNEKKAFKSLYVVLAVIAAIVATVVLTPMVKSWVKPTIIEKTINEVDVLALDSNAVTYTYFVDNATKDPIFVGNSVGYPINPETGGTLQGAYINLIDKEGTRYPVWRSIDGTMIVSSIKLHHEGWTDQALQPPVVRFDSTTVTNTPK